MLKRLIGLGMPRLPGCAAVVAIARHVSQLDQTMLCNQCGVPNNLLRDLVAKMCDRLLVDLHVRQQDGAFWLVSLGQAMPIEHCVAVHLRDYTWYSIDKSPTGFCLVRHYLDQTNPQDQFDPLNQLDPMDQLGQSVCLRLAGKHDQLWTLSTADQLLIVSQAAFCIVQLDNWTVQSNTGFSSTAAPQLFGSFAVMHGHQCYAVVDLPSQRSFLFDSAYLLVCWHNNQLCFAYQQPQQPGVTHVVLLDQHEQPQQPKQPNQTGVDTVDTVESVDSHVDSVVGVYKTVVTNDDKPTELRWLHDKTYTLMFSTHCVECDMQAS
jgi:hypothetical protein